MALQPDFSLLKVEIPVVKHLVHQFIVLEGETELVEYLDFCVLSEELGIDIVVQIPKEEEEIDIGVPCFK